jgi:tetratricopeptide (TPR) repeat protein
MYRFNDDRTPDRLDQARQAVETALRLAPKLPQSHLAKAQFYYYGLHNYEQGLTELQTARSLGGEQAEFVDLSALIERRLGHWNESIRDAERAAELDPQNPFVIRNLVESYVSVRRFSDADRTAGKAIKDAVTRDAVARGGSLWTLRTEALLSTGRIDEARTVIESSPEDATRLYELIWVELFARDFARASQLVEAVAPTEKESFDAAFFDGVTARAQGDVSRTQSAFQRARDWALVKLGERPNDPELISDLSVADAALGRKASAVQEARKAVALCPISRDAVDGANYETELAMVYAWIGERDAAMAELKKVVKLPRGPTWGELRFSPLWNDVRTDTRFDSLLTQAALPPVYN